jgi:hypothetical protein
VRREVRETAQTQRLGHKRQVLEDLALLNGGELVEPGLEERDRGEPTLSRIIPQVPAL